MKYKLEKFSKKVVDDNHETNLFTFSDSEGNEFEVEGGIQSDEYYYDNSQYIKDFRDFGRYVERQDIGNIETDLYNVIFDYLTKEKDFPTE